MTELPSVPARDRILEKLLAAFVKVTGREPTSIALTESTKLRDDLGLDSFAAIELIFELEDLLGVRITRDAAAEFHTVGDVVSCVSSELSAAQAAQPGPQGEAGVP